MSRRPVNSPYTITTEFGVRDSYAKFGYHSGVDYAVPVGRPIYATTAGKIVYARNHPTGGNMVVLYDGRFYHRFMHNSQFKVGEGQEVSEGQEIALAGSTGLSTGPHCHWDMNTRGVEAASFDDFVSPARWLNGEFDVVSAPAPVALLPYQRKVAEYGVNHREAPSTTAAIRQEWAAGEILDFKGFVHGEKVQGNDVWFVGRHTGGYLWSGSFVDMGTHDLQDLTPTQPPVQTPVPSQPSTPVSQYSSRPQLPVTAWGVDVSMFQNTIDFNQLKQHGVQFAILRAGHVGPSHGGDINRADPTLKKFQADARAAGIAVGYYWYCFFDEDPIKEAQRFVLSMGTRQEGEPIFADVEETKGANKEWLLTFLQNVEDLSDSICHIYTYKNYLDNHSWLYELLDGRKLWLAHYDIAPGTAKADVPIIMHQYTSSGKLPGVGSAGIDLNVFLGEMDNFKHLGAFKPEEHDKEPEADEDKEPLPNEEPPAPLPTPENNPVRTKVKWAAIAGTILSILTSVLAVIQESPELTAAAGGTWVTTALTFLTAYMKRDGLSPK